MKQIGDLRLYVCRIGIRGEYYGWVEAADGTNLYTTRRFGGKGAKRRVLEECERWVKVQANGLDLQAGG